MNAETGSLNDFCGTAKLFPLPNLVLFPHAIQPLHLFEPRYRQLIADSLAGDRLITMALLRPGWEETYHLNPPIHPVVCIGRIFQEEKLADGRYNLLLHGVSRARIEEELSSPKLYRLAKVTLLPEESLDCPQKERDLRDRISDRILPWFAQQSAALAQLQKLLQSDLPLGPLCDIISFALPLETSIKQALLEEINLEPRALMLLKRLESQAKPGGPLPRSFPPSFSDN
jgi:Lon protease-like protein